MKRYDCTLSDKRGAFGLCMEERKDGMFVEYFEAEKLRTTHRKREQKLAERLTDATRKREVIAALLRELRDGVEGEWCLPGDLADRIDAALEG